VRYLPDDDIVVQPLTASAANTNIHLKTEFVFMGQRYLQAVADSMLFLAFASGPMLPFGGGSFGLASPTTST
jgi:hypothetical protein